MNEHNMKLLEPYFSQVQSGTKVYEYRILDDKRKSVQVWDLITFTEPLSGKTCTRRVREIDIVSCFSELTNNAELLKQLHEIYPPYKKEAYKRVRFLLGPCKSNPIAVDYFCG